MFRFRGNKINVALIFLALSLLTSACNKNDSEDTPSPSPGLGENIKTSDCGGFSERSMAFYANASTDNSSDECGNETIVWTYQSETKTLVVNHNDLFLNCCGNHYITVLLNEENGVYEIAETDVPETRDGEAIRCNCMCLFEMQVDIPNIEGDTVDIMVTLDVTDDDEAKKTVWEGELDLTSGEGEELVAENVGWCEE